MAEDRFATPLSRKDNPINEPDDVPYDDNALDSTHPSTDTNIQFEEEYDEGLAGAAEATEPNRKDDVIGYDPEKDQRKTK